MISTGVGTAGYQINCLSTGIGTSSIHSIRSLAGAVRTGDGQVFKIVDGMIGDD